MPTIATPPAQSRSLTPFALSPPPTPFAQGRSFTPFALSLSKGMRAAQCTEPKHRSSFDRLRTNGKPSVTRRLATAKVQTFPATPLALSPFVTPFTLGLPLTPCTQGLSPTPLALSLSKGMRAAPCTGAEH